MPQRCATCSVADGLHDLTDARRRRTFIRTARTVIDWRGQTVSAVRHLKLLAGLPVLVAWGSDDKTIAPHHHEALAAATPAFYTAKVADAGHYSQGIAWAWRQAQEQGRTASAWYSSRNAARRCKAEPSPVARVV
jgi:pimeloyl-ACP methyl ester carboxylesterase